MNDPIELLQFEWVALWLCSQSHWSASCTPNWSVTGPTEFTRLRSIVQCSRTNRLCKLMHCSCGSLLAVINHLLSTVVLSRPCPTISWALALCMSSMLTPHVLSLGELPYRCLNWSSSGLRSHACLFSAPFFGADLNRPLFFCPASYQHAAVAPIDHSLRSCRSLIFVIATSVEAKFTRLMLLLVTFYTVALNCCRALVSVNVGETLKNSVLEYQWKTSLWKSSLKVQWQNGAHALC